MTAREGRPGRFDDINQRALGMARAKKKLADELYGTFAAYLSRNLKAFITCTAFLDACRHT
jgi:hypothetical protein